MEKDKLETRRYAHPLDRPDGCSDDHHGVGRDSDAIGGCTGIGWYEYFRDRNSGRRFQVHCTDGVNGGKSAYPTHIMMWRRQCYQQIVARTKAEAAAGVEYVSLSNDEWVIMIGHTAHGWLDRKPGENYATKDNSVTLGVIGSINGVPVLVDPGLPSPLTNVPELSSSRR